MKIWASDEQEYRYVIDSAAGVARMLEIVSGAEPGTMLTLVELPAKPPRWMRGHREPWWAVSKSKIVRWLFRRRRVPRGAPMARLVRGGERWAERTGNPEHLISAEAAHAALSRALHKRLNNAIADMRPRDQHAIARHAAAELGKVLPVRLPVAGPGVPSRR